METDGKARGHSTSGWKVNSASPGSPCCLCALFQPPRLPPAGSTAGRGRGDPQTPEPPGALLSRLEIRPRSPTLLSARHLATSALGPQAAARAPDGDRGALHVPLRTCPAPSSRGSRVSWAQGRVRGEGWGRVRTAPADRASRLVPPPPQCQPALPVPSHPVVEMQGPRWARREVAGRGRSRGPVCA